MLERPAIQQRGFRNVRQNGQIIGFQVRYRSTYYRGVWLSLSLGFQVTVDGEKFPMEQTTVTFGGKTYTQEEMKKISNVQWPNYEAAILTVAKPGGLKPGVHDVQIAWGHRTSYMAPGVTLGGWGPAGGPPPGGPPGGEARGVQAGARGGAEAGARGGGAGAGGPMGGGGSRKLVLVA